MHLKVEIRMESGIFWLWEKWEKLRRDLKNPMIPDEKAVFELSFDKSDVHLVFGVYLIGVLVSVLCMGIEYCTSGTGDYGNDF